MRLVVGLGNPGARYANSRHNAGFMVLERLAQRWGAGAARNQHKSLVDTVRIGHQPAVLCRPQTMMNLSGAAVVALKQFYKIDNDSILVVHDEVELPFGEVRTKAGGGHKGHNGLRDISKRVGNDYHRVRVGVGRPPAGWDTANYVLGTFTKEQSAQLDAVIDDASDAVEAWVA